jgi:hypothetical protein
VLDVYDYLKTRVVADSKWLDRLILSAMVVSLAIIAAKALGGGSFKLGDTEVPTKYAWIVFSGFSVIHLYLACLIIKSSHKLWQDSSTPADTFLKLTAEGGVLLRGLVPRVSRRMRGETYIFKMPFSDLTIWPSYLAIILLMAAVVPFSVNPFERFYLLTLIGLLLAYVNWRIAANWLVALSDLTLPKTNLFTMPG